jgi:SAM-dependent methyltransferase
MIDVGIEKVSETDRERFVQANAEKLPFDDAAFDCVVCVRFLGRIPPGPRVRILRELHRVSRKYLLISTGYFGPGIALRDRLGARFPGLYPKGAKRAKRHAQLHEELAEAGWEEAEWFAYKSRGFLSTTKHIGVYHKDERARKQQ